MIRGRFGGFGGIRLLQADGTEGSHDFIADRPDVIQDGINNALGTVDAFLVEVGAGGGSVEELSLATVVDRLALVGRVGGLGD